MLFSKLNKPPHHILDQLEVVVSILAPSLLSAVKNENTTITILRSDSPERQTTVLS